MQLRMRRLAMELKGLMVGHAYRSHACMIHFQLGMPTEWYRNRDGEMRFCGAYGLMVEIAVWSIRRSNEVLATSNSDYARIDRVLSGIQGQRVVDVRFAGQQSIFSFERGVRLSLSPQPDERGTWHLANWTLFRENRAVVKLTQHASLRFPDVPGGLQAQLRVSRWTDENR
jgi:hypothetical protein